MLMLDAFSRKGPELLRLLQLAVLCLIDSWRGHERGAMSLRLTDTSSYVPTKCNLKLWSHLKYLNALSKSHYETLGINDKSIL